MLRNNGATQLCIRVRFLNSAKSLEYLGIPALSIEASGDGNNER